MRPLQFKIGSSSRGSGWRKAFGAPHLDAAPSRAGFSLLLLLLLLLAGMTACVMVTVPVPTPQGLDGPFRFTLERTGGFVPFTRQVDVDSTSRTLTFSPGRGLPVRQATLDPADVEALRATLKNQGFLELTGPYECPRCADQFRYTATLRLSDQTHVVRFDYFGGTPEPLRELVSHIAVLTGKYFPDFVRP